MPKITVIIPVYNVSQYIEKCVRSLFEQTLEDIEFIFVNDCTPDNSITVIERLLEEYPHRKTTARIVTTPQNSGQATARRYGIIEATGDFIIHCDGDDWVDTDLYERLYNTAIYDNADIVICDEIYEYDTGSELHEIQSLPENCKDVVRYWYRNILGMFCHNKLVKRSLYTHNDILPYEGLNMWEDNGIMMRLFYYGNKLSQIHGSHYHYNRSNINAMTAGYGEKQVMQMIGIAQHLTDFFDAQPDSADFVKTVKALQFLAKINLITDKFSNIERYRTIFPKSETIMSELDIRAFSPKGKIRFTMVRLHMTLLFIMMFKLYNIIK